MKTIILQKINQHGTDCYIGKIDPRKLVRIATKIDMSATQEAQRPLNEKRAKDISSYVSNKGILPNTLTLATKDSRFTVKKCEDKEDLFYIEFPDTENEFSKFNNSIDVMDGQHRLYSFLPELRLINEDDPFEIGFTLYILPTLKERRSIFVSCNEKQEKVSGNLLMWFKKQLGMLNNEEEMFFDVVSKLAEEYPLKGHVIVSAEKITNGVKAKEIMAALKQAKIQDMAISGNPLTDEQKVKVINLYLKCWENVVGFNFATSKKADAGAAITMAGLKYMLLLLPTFWDRAVSLRRSFDETFIEETLKQFISMLGVTRDEFFTCDDNKMCFRDRTAVDLFANKSINTIKGMGAEDFNPLGNI